MANPISSQQGYAGSMRWDTSQLNAETLMKFDQATIFAVKLRMIELAREIRQWMMDHHRWENHPDRHPSARWPSRRTAEEGLFTRVRGTRVLRMDLSHSPSTVYNSISRGRFHYGWHLEATGWGVIQPAIDEHLDRFEQIFLSVLTDEQGFVPDVTFGDDGGLA